MPNFCTQILQNSRFGNKTRGSHTHWLRQMPGGELPDHLQTYCNTVPVIPGNDEGGHHQYSKLAGSYIPGEKIK